MSPQRLRILQPTPSTVRYTVSTRSTPNTVSAKLSLCFSLILRVTLGLGAVLLLWVKWSISRERPSMLFQWTPGAAWEARLLGFTQHCPWRYLSPTVLALLFLVLKRNYTEESLTLLRGLGIQTSTTSSTYLQSPSTRFIPATSIQDIFIYEAFKGFAVRFYLAIVVKGEEDVVVVFPVLLPGRGVLEKVWRGARRCLWEAG